MSSIPSPFNKTIPDFFQDWDNPHLKNNDYLNVFTPEGQLNFGGVPSQGREAILALRNGLIHPENGPVVNCEHTLQKCFVLTGGSGSGRQEFLVKGTIWYELRNGRRVDANFTTYMDFVEAGSGNWQVALHQVFLDSMEIMDAIKEMNAAGL